MQIYVRRSTFTLNYYIVLLSTPFWSYLQGFFCYGEACGASLQPDAPFNNFLTSLAT